MRSALGALTCLALLIPTAEAQSTQRYAAVSGSGTACLQKEPCSLEEAVVNVNGGDEVIVGTGAYAVAKFYEVPSNKQNVYIHGDFAAPMPRIVAAVPNRMPIEAPGAGTRIAYLDITNNAEGAGGLPCAGKEVNRVRVTVSGEFSAGVDVRGQCVLRDSLVRSDGRGSIAVAAFAYSSNPGPETIRNVTAIASGVESSGVTSAWADGFMFGESTAVLENVIAEGAQADLRALRGLEGPGKIVVSYSDFDSAQDLVEGGATVTDAGHNLKAAPEFVNAAAGDYREAPGSPTIDTGVANQLGALDLDGNPRVLGTAPDMGAFETAIPVAAVARISSLQVKPGAFVPTNFGGAVLSKSKGGRAVTAAVSYELSAAGSVTFKVERQGKGRRAGKKCVKKTPGNAGHAKCALFKPVKGGFAATGGSGHNSFKFSGRIGGRALKPGRYRLLGSAGGVTKSAGFTILK